jgi:hypothetical protein
VVGHRQVDASALQHSCSDMTAGGAVPSIRVRLHAASWTLVTLRYWSVHNRCKQPTQATLVHSAALRHWCSD